MGWLFRFSDWIRRLPPRLEARVRMSGDIASIVGATLGAFVFACLVGMIFIAAAYPLAAANADCDRLTCHPMVEAFTSGFLGVIIGWWIGSGLGCWLMLRVMGHANAAITGAAAFGFQFVLSMMVIGVAAALSLIVQTVPMHPLVSMYVLLFDLSLPFEVVVPGSYFARRVAVSETFRPGTRRSPVNFSTGDHEPGRHGAVHWPDRTTPNDE